MTATSSESATRASTTSRWVFHSLIIGTLLLWAYMKLVPEQQMLLAEVAWFGAISLPLMIAMRSIARRLVLHSLGDENVLIAANGATCELIARKLDAHPEYGQRPVAILVPFGGAEIPPAAAAIAEPWVGGAVRARADDRHRQVRPRPGRARRLRVERGVLDDGPLPPLRRQGRRPPRCQRRLRALARARRSRGRDRAWDQPTGPGAHVGHAEALLRPARGGSGRCARPPGHGRDRLGDPPRLARAGRVPPAPDRSRRDGVHPVQVPDHEQRCRGAPGGADGEKPRPQLAARRAGPSDHPHRVASCVARASTSCRSCSTSCGAR